MNKIKKEDSFKMIGMLLPIVITFGALAIQWGVVMTKLDVFGTSIDHLINTNSKQDDILTQVQKDLSYIKGKLRGH